MTRAPRPPKPIESFGPEIFQALVEGSKREIQLPLPYRKAVMFRQRANALRAAMRASNHEQYKVVSQTNLRIVWGKEAGYPEDPPEKRSSQNVRAPVSKNAPAKLIISPSDSEFTEALRAAGVEIKPLSDDPAPNTEAPATQPEGGDVLAQYLKGEPNAADQ